MFKASTLLREGKGLRTEAAEFLSTNAQHLPRGGLDIYPIRGSFYTGKGRLFPDGIIVESDQYTGPTARISIDEFAETHELDTLLSAVEAVGNYIKRHESR